MTEKFSIVVEASATGPDGLDATLTAQSFNLTREEYQQMTHQLLELLQGWNKANTD